ncbi:hypothetical protein N24_0067 [Corynebacterium suranareeae]|uniref:Uncharacterized protein n=2 Tax=Corynebacterium suranareeae TaxID=2506452 RepID=A0A160PL28_9CORY|nr:hypothetical protein N24_0067 [Corynebacterium suranareeae]
MRAVLNSQNISESAFKKLLNPNSVWMPLNATALETIRQPIKDGFLILINFVLDCYGLIMQIFGVPWTDTFQALGTVGAVAVALGIAVVDFFQNTRERRALEAEAKNKTAGLVSAWVETTYEPAPSGKRYDKISHLFISNESDEPVFDVSVDVALENPFRQIGPLSVPVPVPTLPPRRERKFDISSGLLAHDSGNDGKNIHLNEPQARISFTDPRGIRWHRNYSGVLSQDSGKLVDTSQAFSKEMPEQIGVSSFINPMSVTLLLLSVAGSTSPDIGTFKKLLDPNASGWNNVSDERLRELVVSLREYSVPAHVWYRTPRVAYVRLIDPSTLPEKMSEDDGVPIKVELLTFVFRKSTGWLLFSFGYTPPEWIEFDPDETTSRFRSYLDEGSTKKQPNRKRWR